MAINEVIFGGQTLMSLKGDTVTPADLTEGVTAHDASGNLIVGTAARGLPVGFEYLQTNPNVQAGSLPMVGGLWNRTIYADLWAWVQKQPGYLISESEWQALAAANNGAVPFYSTGDGSTTFRVPALTVWVKGASAIEEVGDYLADTFAGHKHNVSVTSIGDTSNEGSHTHTRGTMNITGSVKSDDVNYYWGAGTTASGAFANAHAGGSKISNGNWSGSRGNGFTFDASRSWTGETSENGAHTHTVTITNTVSENAEGDQETRPKTIVGIYCVVAYGSVVSSGEVNLNTLQQAIEDADLTTYVKKEEISSLIDFYSVVGQTTERDSSLPTYGLE